jgi:hypothetical protein
MPGFFEEFGSQLLNKVQQNQESKSRQRDQQALLLEQQMEGIGQNRAQLKAELEQMSDNDPNKVLKQQKYNQLNDALQKAAGDYRGLYGQEELPGFLGRMQGWLQRRGGKGIHQPMDEDLPGGEQGSTAGVDPGMFEAAAPIPKDPGNKFLQDFDNEVRAKMSGGLTKQEAQQEVLRAMRIKQGLEPDTGAAVKEKEKFESQTVTTTDADGVEHHWRIPKDGSAPTEIKFGEGQSIKPKTTPKPVRAWTKENGKFTSVLIDPMTNKKIPGSENSDVQPPVGMQQRISTGTYHWVDEDGNLHATQETRTTGPASAGGGPPAKPPAPAKDLPKNAGEARDRILGNKGTPETRKANEGYSDAIKLYTIAQDAQAQPSAAKDKALALSLIRTAAGRVSMAEVDTMVKKYGLANTLESWANSATTGELPRDVRNQLVGVAKSLMEGAKAARDDAHKGSSAPTGKSTGKGSGTATDPFVISAEDLK